MGASRSVPEGGEPAGRRERTRRQTRSLARGVGLPALRRPGLRGHHDLRAGRRQRGRAAHLYRYFATKEDVIFAGADERTELIRTALEARPLDEPLLVAVRSALVGIADELVGSCSLERLRTGCSWTRRLRSRRAASRSSRTAPGWSPSSSRRASRCEPGDMWPAIVGRATISVMAVARRRWIFFPREADYGMVIGEAFVMLEDFVRGHAWRDDGPSERGRQ